MSRASGRRALYLERMGVQLWEPRFEPVSAAAPDEGGAEAAEAVVAEPAPVAQAAAEAASPVADLDAQWDTLHAEVAACDRCKLCSGRTQTVFGVGNRAARLVVVGEAPGAEEDRTGEPFVGRAGKLLDNMLRAIGLPRETVYICNILKCRPPNNRDPQPDEVEACEPYLQSQLALLRPDAILAVGRVAAQNLLKTDAPLGKLRGRLHHYGPNRVPVVVTYHPAYLLRSPKEKARAWQDLKFARGQLGSGS